VPGADSRYQPLGRHHHRRHDVRLLPQVRHRIQLLPRHPHADGRRRLLGVEAARPAAVVRPAHVRHRHRLRLFQRMVVHPLVDSLRVHARLHRVCVVSDRVWVGGAVDGVYGVGGVERVKSGHLIRSNFLSNLGFYYWLLLRPDRKYYSHE
jgi:hypothetical protein